MGTENVTTGHVACGFQLAAGKQPSRRRGARARRAKDRRGAANHAKAPIAAPAADAASRRPPLEASEATKAAAEATAPLPCEEIRAVATVDALEVNVVELPGCEAEQAESEQAEAEQPKAEAANPEAEQAETPLVRAASSPNLTSPSSTEAAPVEAPRAPRLRRGRTWPLSVSFGEEVEVSVHSITPYAEVYGMHPRLFDFDKGFAMVPSQGFGAARQALIAAAAEIAARRARGEDPTGLEDEDDEEAHSEDDSSDDDFSTEYHLAPPRDAAQSERMVAVC